MDWAAGRVSGCAQVMGGRVLGLFASTRRLERVAQVQARLEPQGIEVLRQTRGHGRSLAARQERDAGTVLLGTKSFWQGVDIPGRRRGLRLHRQAAAGARGPPAGGGARGDARGRAARRGALGLRGLPAAAGAAAAAPGRGPAHPLARGPGRGDHRGPGAPELPAAAARRASGYRVEALPWAEARVRVHAELVEMGLTLSGS